MRDKIVLERGSKVFESGTEPKLARSVQLRLCCNEVTLGQIADFVNRIYPDARIQRPSPDENTISKTATGTFDEVMKQIGLEASEY